jgi:integrase
MGARSAHITQNSLSRALRGVCRRLKRIGVSPFTPHDLRRSVETGMAMAKVGKEHRDRVLNHIDNSVGGRHYNKHEYLEEKRSALLAWRDKLRSALSEAASVVVPLRRQSNS